VKYEVVGRCFHCHELLEALQPSGGDPRHVADRVPYGRCYQAREDRARRQAQKEGLPFYFVDEIEIEEVNK